MTSTTPAVGILLSFTALARAVIPDGYTLKVTPYCGSDAIADASIHFMTDLKASGFARCSNGTEVDFTTTDNVNFNLSVSYPNQGSQPCVFNIDISYGEAGREIHEMEEEFTVTCTFNPIGTDDSVNQNVVEGLIAPGEIQANMGNNSRSTFTLELVDILGNPFGANKVALGRIVQLRGVTSAVDGEVGIRPVSCFAIDGNASYAILRAGCGDGIVFSKSKGFLTTGTTTMSPYFDTFSINIGAVVQFQCNFVVCTTNCDGSSCRSENGAVIL